MPIETFPFDPVDYLDSEEGIEEYLLAATEEGDPDGIADAQAVAARAREKLANRAASGD